MKKFVEFWNRIYYSLYSFHYFVGHFIVGKMAEVLLLRPIYAIPLVKRRLTNFGITWEGMLKTCNDFVENRKDSRLMGIVNVSITYVLYGIEFYVFVVLWLIFGDHLLSIIFDNLKLFCIISGGLCILFCQFTIWKNNQYLKYFRKFDKESLKKRIVWCIGTQLFCVALAVGCYFICKMNCR